MSSCLPGAGVVTAPGRPQPQGEGDMSHQITIGEALANEGMVRATNSSCPDASGKG